MLTYEQALATVKEKLSRSTLERATETLPLAQIRGRVLAEDVGADRDYPPFHRAARDGYALRSQDINSLPAMVESVGEVRAGEHFVGKLGPGQCVEIMTGAPVPEGADAVVMIEHVRAQNRSVEVLRAVHSYENVVQRGSESLGGSRVLARGRHLNAYRGCRHHTDTHQGYPWWCTVRPRTCPP